MKYVIIVKLHGGRRLHRGNQDTDPKAKLRLFQRAVSHLRQTADLVSSVRKNNDRRKNEIPTR
jgi:hypothetical protein